MRRVVDKTAVFESIPVKKAVCMQIIPAIASQMIALIYNLADTYFVGMLNEPNQTAAVTVVYSSFVMLTAISNLFGVGGASALSRALGKKQDEDARKYCRGLLLGRPGMRGAFLTAVSGICPAGAGSVRSHPGCL